MTELHDEASALMSSGDFAGAAGILGSAFARSGDKVDGVMLLVAQFYTLDFSGAKATLDRLQAAAPELGSLIRYVTSCAAAEWTRHRRLEDGTLAGERAGFQSPPPFALLYAKAACAHATKDFAGAKATLEEIALARPKVSGIAKTVRGDLVRFIDFFDSDDLTGATFPIYYQSTIYDLPIVEIASLEFLPKSDVFYSLWPSVSFTMKSGTRGTVAFPALYPGSTVATEPTLRLGRTTAWDHDRGYAVAEGLRDFWVIGEDGSRRMMGVTSFERIDFALS